MRYLILSIIIFTLLLSCSNGKSLDVKELRTGTFETHLDDSDEVSTAVRTNEIQIETYNNKKDTFNIEWKSNFEYILRKVNPKKGLDSTPFHVKITGIKGNKYTFKAYYKGSNFKQKGTAIKLKKE